MGTAMRFITALGGVVLIAFAWGLFGYPIVQTIAEPQYAADFPGRAAGFVVVLLMMGSVPFGGGVLLIPRALRGRRRNRAVSKDIPRSLARVLVTQEWRGCVTASAIANTVLPLMLQGTPPGFNHRVRERQPGERRHTVQGARGRAAG